ncbi:MAG: hypothetical protein H6867_06280 [Rhodospirillales bacterium]|nr:hypothetical protein [Rhodospirillales bacterium]MCB9995138.1 hypothetical protein [Rhodospirillales bacterium]
MWLVIWCLFAVFIFVFVGWTAVILFQQKKTWANFAKRHKLEYEAGTIMGSPVVSGMLNERRFSLYTGAQQTDDIRGQRFVTIIEFQMGQGMPTGAAIATMEYLGFVDGLVFDESYDPGIPEWKSSYVVRTRDSKNLQAYLTDERLKLLQGLFSMKGASVLLFFDELEAVLRIETSDPLREGAHLDKIIKRLSDAADKLVPSAVEKERFKTLIEEEKARHKAVEKVAQVEDEEVEDDDADDVDLGVDLEALTGDDDDEHEIIIIKKKKSKKKAPAKKASSNKKKSSD